MPTRLILITVRQARRAPGSVSSRRRAASRADFEQRRLGAGDVDRGEHDRAARRLPAGAALDRLAVAPSDANQRLTTPAALPLPARARALAERDLVGMLEVEGELRRRSGSAVPAAPRGSAG